jgi:hypothetical protein
MIQLGIKETVYKSNGFVETSWQKTQQKPHISFTP